MAPEIHTYLVTADVEAPPTMIDETDDPDSDKIYKINKQF
jgi:hypothetical protein